jgi:hypothetical protein
LPQKSHAQNLSDADKRQKREIQKQRQNEKCRMKKRADGRLASTPEPTPLRVSQRRFENSPAFQRRVCRYENQSPGGTTENVSRPDGTWTVCGLNPALKCRAIFSGSVGTRRLFPCTAGWFWEDSFMAEAIGDKMRQFASRILSFTSVTDCLLSELANTGSA